MCPIQFYGVHMWLNIHRDILKYIYSEGVGKKIYHSSEIAIGYVSWTDLPSDKFQTHILLSQMNDQ
jgi:hypothetical protein